MDVRQTNKTHKKFEHQNQSDIQKVVRVVIPSGMGL